MVPNTRELSGRGAIVGLALLVPLASIPTTALAASSGVALPLMMRGPDMTPEKAAELRIAPQTTARGLVQSGHAAQAGSTLDRSASEFGDPVLYLDAGDAYLAAADADRDTKMCDAATERAAIALDILYFHLDRAADDNFRFVATPEIPALIVRAQDMQTAAAELKEEIENDVAEPVAAAEPTKKKRPKGDGKVLRISGIGVASLGGALAAVGVVGLGMGAFNQSKAEDNSVYGAKYDQVAQKGQRANVIAGVGLGLGGAALVAGVTMYLIGASRGKKAGKRGRDKEDKAVEDQPVVRVSPTLNGMVVMGRF